MEVLDFLDYIYENFNMQLEFELSTRPENRLGTDDMWDQAEGALENALNNFGRPWKLNPGDGAFYGPKIDIKVKDALNRYHQCGTVQCDFQLPIRFNLQYQSANAASVQEGAAAFKKEQEEKKMDRQVFPADHNDDKEFIWEEKRLKPGFERPIIVHRAILGSVERFMAILIEHLAGKWPFWMSPRQIIVLPISQKAEEYCESVYLYFHRLGYEVVVDHSSTTI
jgi:threonyl-tRNA synthetase